MAVGDQITRINGHTPRNFIEFAVRLLDLGNNPTVQIDIKRGDDFFLRAVNLVPEKTFLNSGLIREKTGVSLEALTPEVARALGFNSAEGFVVTQVDADSPADKAGLTTGLVVVAIDDRKVSDIVNAARLLNRKRSGEGLKLSLVNIRRKGIFLRRTTESVILKVP
jgi:predicted metalloprotease with PDZ domain